jgi:serine/threonine protein kinase
MTDEAYPDALPAGYRLHWYVLERVLGQGGFGITYLARDTNLDRRVAIKEYLPSEVARRRSDAAAHPRTDSQSERYSWGLERFLSEARTLARFDHPNIVRVHSVFEANNTAYMVMRFEEGESLAALLDRSGMLTERQLTNWLLPIVDGLERVHAEGYIHRDIKPDNIYLRADGSPVLLDFGSARQAFGRSKTMTILVAPGYAPLEQYYGDATTQGPWTDIYGLGATCYRAIAGRVPLDAIARAKGVLGSAREVLPSAVDLGRGRYSEALLTGIDHALRLSEDERPQSLVAWRRELVAGPGPLGAERASPPTSPASAKPPPPATQTRPAPAVGAASATTQRLRWIWLAAAAVGATSAAALLLPRASVNPAPRSTLADMPPRAAPAAALLPAPPSGVLSAPVELARAPASAFVAPAVGPAFAAAQPGASERPPRPPATAPGKPALTESRSAALVPPPGQTDPPAPGVRSPLVADGPPPLSEAQPVDAARLALIAPPPARAASTSVAPSAPPATAVALNEGSVARPARIPQIDEAEAALRRGEGSAAVRLLAPWAAAGNSRAQALLGRAKATLTGAQQSHMEAYMWLRLAARGGEAGAQALSEKVAAQLQPAEIRQADQLVDQWLARAPAKSGAAP